MQPQGGPAEVPVNIYRTADRVVVAAPMPGLVGDQDITVEVTHDQRLILQGERRGEPRGVGEYHVGGLPLVEQKNVVQAEWSAGPYRREVALPWAVDGPHATVTYGNGILVAALPLAAQTQPARLTLEAAGPFRAERVGSAGHPVSPVTTREHQEATKETQAEHGGAEHPFR